MCHFYNTYFAHTAGGRMIGSKVSQMILDNKQLNFYKYDSDVKELLNGVRDNINEVSCCLHMTSTTACVQGCLMYLPGGCND